MFLPSKKIYLSQATGWKFFWALCTSSSLLVLYVLVLMMVIFNKYSKYCSPCCYWGGGIIWVLVLFSKTNGTRHFYLLWSYIVNLNWDILSSHFRLKYCTFLSSYPGLHHETEKCITGNLPSHWPVTSDRECLTVCWTEPLLCGCKWGFPGQATQLRQTRLFSTRIGTHF